MVYKVVNRVLLLTALDNLQINHKGQAEGAVWLTIMLHRAYTVEHGVTRAIFTILNEEGLGCFWRHASGDG